MEPQKSMATITTKPISKSGSGKGESVDEDRASLVKASKLPSYLQRRSASAEDEEKKEKDLVNKKAAMGNVVVLQPKI